MNIKSAQYYTQIDGTDNVGRKANIDNEEMFVPLDSANRHYAEILKQVAEKKLTIKDAD